MIDKYMALYEGNKEFHDYIERLTRSGKKDHGKKLDDILARKTVREIGEYYLRKSGGLEKTPGFPTGNEESFECECKSC